MDKALLEKAMLAIESHSEQFAMEDWVMVNGEPYFTPHKDMVEEIRNPSCGTTLCLAGWVCHVALAEGREWPTDITGDPLHCVGFAALKYLGLINYKHKEAMRKMSDIMFLYTLDTPPINTPAELRSVLVEKGFLDS